MARFPIAPIVEAAWGLRHNVSLNDALYLALARTIGCPLLTFDRGLATAPVRGTTITLLT
jgi:predicted nucleic acid-binding protein